MAPTGWVQQKAKVDASGPREVAFIKFGLFERVAHIRGCGSSCCSKAVGRLGMKAVNCLSRLIMYCTDSKLGGSPFVGYLSPIRHLPDK